MTPLSQSDAFKQLEAFLPRAGGHYAANRNHDEGPTKRRNVSMLSPWVRLRALPEWTLCQETLTHHSASAASNFIDEVCWRTYWKGWLEGRPGVWKNYQNNLKTDLARYGKNSTYLRTIHGETSIDCMDTWTRELVETGYLHNHARMWFASIWIHTLRLPWSLGAAFFLKHLLDGDVAANTLSWRWVVGLHTLGKSYLASRGNIQRYSSQPFKVEIDLATDPIPADETQPKPPFRPPSPLPELPSSGRIGLLLHDDDLSAAQWLSPRVAIISQAAYLPKAAYLQHEISEPILQFRCDALRQKLPETGTFCSSVEQILDWAARESLDHVVMAQPFVGFWDDELPFLRNRLSQEGRKLTTTRHWWDDHFFPHSKAGFFRFKKAIPGALKKLHPTAS